MNFLEGLNEYDFFVRDSLVLLLLALSIYVLLQAGMFALPQVGFMAIGAYVAAIAATRYEQPLVVSLGLALLAGLVTGLLLALVLIRLNGIYLAIATIAFGEIVRVTIRNLDIAGGGTPLVGVPRTVTDVVLVGTVLLVVVGLWRLSRTRFGLAVVMIREDPLSAAHQGISVRTYRTALFALSGAVAATAGALSVHVTGFVEPGLFDFNLLVDALAATVLGGMTSVVGPIVGGVVIFGLPELLHALAEYRTMVNGLLIVAVVAFAPDGLVSLGRLARRFRPRRPRSALAEPTAIVARPLTSTPRPGDGEPLLTARGLARHFGGIKALDGIDLEIRTGEIFGVIGPNGSGKTTLLNVISGVYRPSVGEVLIGDVSAIRGSGRPARMAGFGISRTFQAVRLLEGHTVLENVVAGAYRSRSGEGLIVSLLALPSFRRSRNTSLAQARALLDELEMGDLAEDEADALPYGQQRKIEIARALISKPRLLLLDEPTAGMSPTERDEVFALVQAVRSRGVTVVVIEHDVRAMTANCDRLAVLNFGKVLIVDTPQRAIESEAVIDAYIGRTA